MPEIVICGYCGCVLYEDDELLSPIEILKKYDGRCPKCSAILKFNSANVEVKTRSESDKSGIFKVLRK